MSDYSDLGWTPETATKADDYSDLGWKPETWSDLGWRPATKEDLHDEMRSNERVGNRAGIVAKAADLADRYLVRPISQMNPLTVLPRAAFGVDQALGLAGPDEEFPLENGKPIVSMPRFSADEIKSFAQRNLPASIFTEDIPAQVAAGTEQAAAGLGDFMATPEGLTTALIAPYGSTVPAAARALSAGFGIQMGSSVPDAASAAGEASVNGSLADKVRTGLDLGANIGMPMMLGRHAFSDAPRVTLNPPEPADPFEGLGWIPEPETSVDQAATAALDPQNAQWRLEPPPAPRPGVPPEPVFGGEMPRDSQTLGEQTMAAVQPEPPALVPRQVSKRPYLGSRADGNFDLLDAINDLGGVAAPTQTRFAEKGDYDGYAEAFGSGPARLLRRSKGGLRPDELSESLANYGYNFPTTGHMFEAIQRASSARPEADSVTQDPEADFMNAALTNEGKTKADTSSETVPVNALKIGDTFEIKGEKLIVKEIDPDTGNVTVEDGRVFGKQELPADQHFFPDKNSFEPAEVEENPWDPSQEPDAEVVHAAETPADNPHAEDIRGLVDYALADKSGSPDWVDLPAISEHDAAAVKLATGVDVTGFTRVIDDSAVRHILNEHGDAAKEAARSQIAVTKEDIAKIPEIVSNFDTLEAGDVGHHGVPNVIYSKAENGTTYYVEEVRTGRKKLAAVSMWKKPGEAPHIHPMEDLQRTPETNPAQTSPESTTPGKVHAMGSGAARSPRPASVQTPARPTVPASLVPAARTTVGPLQEWFTRKRINVQKHLAPQSIDAGARTIANILRDYNAEAAVELARADEALKSWRNSFDRTPVPADWKYDPSQPLPRNYAFMDESERGGANLNAEEKLLKAEIDRQFGELINDVQAVSPNALKSLITDYFPHIWKDPQKARDAFKEILGRKPLEGSRGFLKKRVLEYTRDGLEAGLEPVSDNPIDLVLLKQHEMRKFILAQKTLRDAKAIGARKFVYVYEQAPDGWKIVDDRTSTVHAPPFVTVEEAFDAQLRAKTIELMNKLGFPHERVARLPGQRWGEFHEGSEEIKTQFGGPDWVIWHELGHGLESRYKLSNFLMGDETRAGELRKLADLRYEGQTVSKNFKRYVRSTDEKMAVVLQAYMHAPERMKQVAPNVYDRFRRFIHDHPELHDIDEIKPSLTLGTAKSQVRINGQVTLGRWYMPEGAAAVMNNYLSPGLSRSGLYRTLRSSSNFLNGSQLGLSAFHVGFTSVDSAVSRTALGLKYMADGKPITGLAKILSTPVAPVTNARLGYKVRREMLKPGSYGGDIPNLAQMAIRGGLRATSDPMYAHEFSRKFVRAISEGGLKNYGKSAIYAPMVAMEKVMGPLLENLVPWQKLGVFADMARFEMERLGPNASVEQIREVMAKAADSTENRMGQMTYDNLFMNRTIKDVAQLGFRAFGWQLGKYREGLGAVADTGKAVGKIVHLEKPELTHRMAYAVALPMVVGAIGGVMHKLMTGQNPQTMVDYYFPSTGKVGQDGKPERVMLPSYLKDMISDWKDFPNVAKMGASFYHKLNPWSAVAVDMLRNRDFYDVRIRNEDDPVWSQVKDAAKYAAGSFTPFSITGARKLAEVDSSPRDWILPFIGVVPAKKALTMTPAEAKSAELMQDMLPKGARTKEQFEHSELVKTLARELKNDPATGRADLAAAAAAGKLKSSDATTIVQRLQWSPLQYQASKLSVDNVMRVWDLAKPEERAALRPIVLKKIVGSKTVDLETKQRYIRLVGATQ